jgi:hypothetical protein
VRPYLEKTHHKIQASRVAQGVGHEFKPQYHNNKNNKIPKTKKSLNQHMKK